MAALWPMDRAPVAVLRMTDTRIAVRAADPATSALDTNCKAHELDNLSVVNTSFFPNIGALNPALTAIANALRVGDHIANRIA